MKAAAIMINILSVLCTVVFLAMNTSVEVVAKDAKVKAAGICGTDIHFYEGSWGVDMPIINGHEFAGEVVEVGNEVVEFKVGDKVSADPNMELSLRHLRGRESPLLPRRRRLCLYGVCFRLRLGSFVSPSSSSSLSSPS